MTQVPINALTGKVGTRTKASGNPRYVAAFRKVFSEKSLNSANRL